MAKKSYEKRMQESLLIRDKLQSLGLTNEIESIKKFEQHLKEFEDGFSSSGSIKLYGLKRKLDFILSCQNHITSTVNLKYEENI